MFFHLEHFAMGLLDNGTICLQEVSRIFELVASFWIRQSEQWSVLLSMVESWVLSMVESWVLSMVVLSMVEKSSIQRGWKAQYYLAEFHFLDDVWVDIADINVEHWQCCTYSQDGDQWECGCRITNQCIRLLSWINFHPEVNIVLLRRLFVGNGFMSDVF